MFPSLFNTKSQTFGCDSHTHTLTQCVLLPAGISLWTLDTSGPVIVLMCSWAVQRSVKGNFTLIHRDTTTTLIRSRILIYHSTDWFLMRSESEELFYVNMQIKQVPLMHHKSLALKTEHEFSWISVKLVPSISCLLVFIQTEAAVSTRNHQDVPLLFFLRKLLLKLNLLIPKNKTLRRVSSFTEQVQTTISVGWTLWIISWCHLQLTPQELQTLRLMSSWENIHQLWSGLSHSRNMLKLLMCE